MPSADELGDVFSASQSLQAMRREHGGKYAFDPPYSQTLLARMTDLPEPRSGIDPYEMSKLLSDRCILLWLGDSRDDLSHQRDHD
jgi:hypothetical protein